MRTSAYSWKKNPKVSQRSQKGLLGDTSPKLRKKQLDFPGMDLFTEQQEWSGNTCDKYPTNIIDIPCFELHSS